MVMDDIIIVEGSILELVSNSAFSTTVPHLSHECSALRDWWMSDGEQVCASQRVVVMVVEVQD